MRKCHKCSSRFIVIAYLKKKDFWGYPWLYCVHPRISYLCRTCAFGHSLEMDKKLNSRVPLIIPFVKKRIWSLDNRLV